MKDLHNNIKASRVLSSASISSNTTTAGQIIDMQGYKSLEFLLAAATITDGTYTPKIEHSDAADMSGAEDVGAEQLLGTIAGATFAATDDNAVKKVGYRGIKRYLRLSLVSTSVSTGGSFTVLAIQGHPDIAPVV